MKKLTSIILSLLLVLVLVTASGAKSTVVAQAAITSISTSAAQTLQVSYYAIPSGGAARSIAAGSDGNLWFTIDRTGQRSTYQGQVQAPVKGSIGRVTPQGVVTEYPLSEITYRYIDEYVDSVSFDITAGPDGNMWFTEAEANKVGKITSQGVITEYALSDTGMYPRAITSGPDGTIWIMIAGNPGATKIVNMATDGTIIKELPLDIYNYGQTLTFGPDGNLWLRGSTNIIRLKTNGDYTEFSTGVTVIDIVPGSNNDLWFSQNGGSFARITTNGDITYPTPGESAWDITKDSDNRIWFKDNSSEEIRSVDSNGGDITVYSLSTPDGYGVWGPMVFGPDGNIWVSSNNRIAKIDLTIATPTPSTEPTVSNSTTPTQGVTPTVVVEPTGVTPTLGSTAFPTVEVTPTAEVTPTRGETEEDPTGRPEPTVTHENEPTAIPTVEVTASPTATENKSEVSPTASPTPSTKNNAEPTPTVAPSGGQSMAQILGATTMAKTGSLDQLVMNISGIFGMLFTAAGSLIYAKGRFRK